ncbi:MAG TPA: MFS transporter, partial [Caulobacteraceae bacterium]
MFASGDFGFNLFWQSLMLYQLFYYTETLRIPMAEAATCYAIAAVWDGLASFAVGILTDRRGDERFYRRALILGAAPLGLSFVLSYSPPPAGGPWILARILGG